MKSFSYPRIFIIGLGFFSISIVWQLYNSFMPLMLGDFIESKALRGSIMGLDNLANIFLIPIIGAYSDRLDTRFGKRLPFLLIGMPLAALFLFIMPHYLNLGTLIAIDVGFLLCMTLFRAPTISLMPDFTPPDRRSQANGIINLMGGIGSLITLFVLSKLYDHNKPLPFYIGGIVLLAVVLVLVFYLKKKTRDAVYEDTSAAPEDNQNTTGIIKGLAKVLTDKDRSALLILLAIFFWFVGYSGVEAQFTTYGVEYMGLSESSATLTIGFFSLAFILFAVPSGFLAKKFGRVRTIITGISGLSALFILLFFIDDVSVMRGILLAGGVFWALVNIHSYPLVVSFAGPGRIGLYTGLYYLFSSIASTVGPAILGGCMDAFGAPAMFIGSACAMMIALIFLISARRAAIRIGSVQAAV
ncbi:MFS transporter [Gorillibacterium massiliense]|uniref:MFS transporter n=1 Tax=Gorillibacterium massiliense TaxID=1280390 RepID=UPI0004B8B420|nr:MFS transporter [Gorillibacterium massiliense]